MSDIALAEQLWTRAHEHVRRGEFADAVRDLAQAFQILQAANDPRLYEVHRRWTEVHQMYLEDGARAQTQQAAQAQQTPSLEAEAEAAANAGELDRAIQLYQRVVNERPTHELARERLHELQQARTRAHELVSGKSAPIAAVTTPPSTEASPTLVPATAAEDDWSDVAVDDSGPSASAPAADAAASDVVREVSGSMIEASIEVGAEIEAAPAGLVSEPAGGDVEIGYDVKFSDEMSFADLNEPAAAQQAPAMAPEDAPIGMQSLDVPFSVGAAISEENADELPVEGGPSLAPAPATSSAVVVEAAAAPTASTTVTTARDGPASASAQDQIAFLNELLVRVAHNRRVA